MVGPQEAQRHDSVQQRLEKQLNMAWSEMMSPSTLTDLTAGMPGTRIKSCLKAKGGHIGKYINTLF